MHILIVIVGGLAALALFYFGYRLAGHNPASGAALFIWVWLAASALNGCVGVLKARVAGVSALRSGLEVAVLAAASGLISFGLGRLASVVLGVDIRG